MKLVVTICAYNESASIADVLQSIPRGVQGVNDVQIVVVDDGSSDGTADIARQSGADVVLVNTKNLGLARSYKRALEHGLLLGADILVHTDADNQYDQSEIKKVIDPIINGSADMVVGDRQVKTLDHMPHAKRHGNQIGSFVVGLLTGLKGIDASSGFRALSRDAALQLTSFSGHTYTHQTLIEASHKKLHIVSVPIAFNPRSDGSSRLIGGVFSHIRASIFVIIRALLVYRPLKTFVLMGGLSTGLGVLLGIRFLYYFFFVSGSGKIQSLILVAILLVVGVLFFTVGFLGDVIAHNRRLLDEILYKQKKQLFKDRDR
ncbi:MAG: glycosyltransferase family 2 protein [Patescibacteria group bacterium]